MLLNLFATQTPQASIPRRRLLQAGGLSLFSSLTLPRLLQAQDANRHRPAGPAKSVILFNLLGGPSQLDMFDMKPGAPLEIRPDRTGRPFSIVHGGQPLTGIIG